MAKRKMTGFARLLLAIIIIGPLAYLGASYINGEDGIGNIKRMIGLDSNTSRIEEQESNDEAASDDTCELQLRSLKKQVKNLRVENEQLRQEIQDLQK